MSGSSALSSRSGLLLFLLGAAALILAGCARSDSAAAPGEDPWRKHALWVERDAQTTPIENGEKVRLGVVAIEIFVAPYPPLREGSIDLLVTEAATGRPLEDSVLRIVFDMYMPHGILRVEALPTGGGHFLVPYRLVMPGEWRANITVTGEGTPATLGLVFRVD